MLALPRWTIVRVKRARHISRDQRQNNPKAPKTTLLGSFEHMLANQVDLIARYED